MRQLLEQMLRVQLEILGPREVITEKLTKEPEGLQVLFSSFKFSEQRKQEPE